MSEYEVITVAKIKAAQKRISDTIIHTPLLKLNLDDAPAEVYLKLENLQPIGAFKLRGATSKMKQLTQEQLKDGVYAFSSGNHGRGVAYNARKMGVKCTIITSDETPPLKINELKKLGAEVKIIPYPHTPEGWQRLEEVRAEMKGLEISSRDPDSLAGYGTIGLEILEDLPDVDAVLMPFGSGGLCTGLSSAIRAINPRVKLYGCEIDTSAPFAASLEAGELVEVERVPSFINSIGYTRFQANIWEIVRMNLDGSIVVSIREVCDAVRMLAERNKVIAEGAGAVSVAAALSGKAGTGKIVCVVSGGNEDLSNLLEILQGNIPNPH
ncbi:pyridoxal-phosphate dependent enzyme [Candidatus Bathyarchaeota archaeon]|nr:MAG: pyridoxal-phosphate dependent enzyme [Candidatus Bathyarchaeota archaeon]